MRLASFRIHGNDSYGIVTDKDGVVDLGKRLEQRSLLELLRSDSFETARRHVTEMPDYSLAEISLRLPIQGGEKIICVGINYPEREEEYGGALKRGAYPNLFVKFPSAFSAPGENIIRPKVSDQLDYEGEVVLVIGRPGRHIPANLAHQHIAAITAANEGTVRDWVNHGTKNITQGKNFERSGSMGPWIVTSDELDPTRDLRIITKVSGEIRQNDSTKNMYWKYDELISYISTFSTLLPGDLILTGTPVGAGAHMNPPTYLKEGDTVEVNVEGVGTLSNTVQNET